VPNCWLETSLDSLGLQHTTSMPELCGRATDHGMTLMQVDLDSEKDGRGISMEPPQVRPVEALQPQQVVGAFSGEGELAGAWFDSSHARTNRLWSLEHALATSSCERLGGMQLVAWVCFWQDQEGPAGNLDDRSGER
jgi:hypothetical protein